MHNTLRHTADYLQFIQSNGRYAFTIEDLTQSISKPLRNIRKDIDRLRVKGEVQTIRKGFYVSIPVEYRKMGMVPVEFYIDELMKFLSRNYYVGLFSAAMFHGAAHQQPQEFFVVSKAPVPRTIRQKNLAINFSEKKGFPEYGIEEKKTGTGYFRISDPALTFLDLVYFENHIGGLNRIVTVLQELIEMTQISQMKKAVKNPFPISVFQRVGFIVETILQNPVIAEVIEQRLAGKELKSVKLLPGGDAEGAFDSKWKVIINTPLETDL
jgi:predicted transcriptional regulator of viral defense system